MRDIGKPHWRPVGVNSGPGVFGEPKQEGLSWSNLKPIVSFYPEDETEFAELRIRLHIGRPGWLVIEQP